MVYRTKEKFESMAKELGFLTVHEQKKALTRLIRSYVGNGGFIFAMCSATDTYDIALAEEGITQRTMSLMERQ